MLQLEEPADALSSIEIKQEIFVKLLNFCKTNVYSLVASIQQKCKKKLVDTLTICIYISQDLIWKYKISYYWQTEWVFVLKFACTHTHTHTHTVILLL